MQLACRACGGEWGVRCCSRCWRCDVIEAWERVKVLVVRGRWGSSRARPCRCCSPHSRCRARNHGPASLLCFVRCGLRG
jgi:hypothetical protein